MDALTFREVANLLNHTRIFTIEHEKALREGDGWALFQGMYRFHTVTQPVQVYYFEAKATREAIGQAAKEMRSAEKAHVVYAPSLRQAAYLKETFGSRVEVLANSKEYLRSFMSEQLGVYEGRLGGQRPKYYVEPQVQTPIGTTHKIPNPLLAQLRDDDGKGRVIVLLAEAGQGKTCQCQYLVAELPKGRNPIVPIYIESTQWASLPKGDLESLWKTITHSFRYFGASVPWTEGCEDEFVRATLKARLFVLVFDGFDEYILRNPGHSAAEEVLETLVRLASETGTRILITSRTSFWEANLGLDSSADQSLLVYELCPFEQQQAKNYFEKRLTDPAQRNKAANLFGTLRSTSGDLIGRGFVLSLIADLFASENKDLGNPGHGSTALLWLIEKLCLRERLRQTLPLSAEDQIRALTNFARETATGEEPSEETFEFALFEAREDLPEDVRRDTLTKLRSHPLVGMSDGAWAFRSDQVAVALLASLLHRGSDVEIAQLAPRLRLEAGFSQDVASMIVDMAACPANDCAADLRRVTSGLRKATNTTSGSLLRRAGGTAWNTQALVTSIALLGVERLVAKGAPRSDRTACLKDLLGGAAGVLDSLVFKGALTGFNFSGVTFARCHFERVSVANCDFDERTRFQECSFEGGVFTRADSIADATFDEKCTLDSDATAWRASLQVQRGRRTYSLQDLEQDFEAILHKFAPRGGFALKTVTEPDLKKGPIRVSRHRDEIIAALMSTVLEHHTISGVSERGINVRTAAEDAVKFYFANNVRQGPLAAAFETLKRQLSL